MTVDEWRELERANPDAKYEYIDGQVYLISRGSLAHSRISSNTVRAFEDALASEPCYVYNSVLDRMYYKYFSNHTRICRSRSWRNLG
jgi:Uma2 family endonuclease